MPRVARVGDTSSHGGQIQTGSADVIVNGSSVARVGDTFGCPTHGPNPIVSSPVSGKFANGSPIATVGATTQCGAVITEGSTNVNAS
jgi:uncharacterized Zn-binding protein involved in type VI secretion